VLWLLTVIWLFFGAKGEITLINESVNPESLSYLQRVLFAIVFSVFFFLLLKVTYHFRQLILHFANGDIFNKKATIHARKALLYALAIYGVLLASTVVMWIYTYIQNQFFYMVINGDYIFGLIIFGLMYVLLWALEIGCDLNEESELTI
jgi:hypothetical protein